VPPEVLRQVRRLELEMRGMVNAVFGGEYRSVFRGQGVEFSEVRAYEPGDDVRHIDWNVTARMGHPFVKRHVEERELTLLLCVDLSGSTQFGTRTRFKADVSAEASMLLALSAVRNNDRVGLLLFTDRIEHVVPPDKGRRHVLRLIRDLMAADPRGTGTDVGRALDYAARMLPHRSIIFVMSDFIAPGPGPVGANGIPDWEKRLRTAAGRHDVIALRVTDTGDSIMPAVGLVRLLDPETGRETLVDTGAGSWRVAFDGQLAREETYRTRAFRQAGVDEIELHTSESTAPALLAFFRRRQRRRQR
jgi:uncharacterized protein (DUF58 family)